MTWEVVLVWHEKTRLAFYALRPGAFDEENVVGLIVYLITTNIAMSSCHVKSSII